MEFKLSTNMLLTLRFSNSLKLTQKLLPKKISVGFNEPDDPETKLYYGLSMTGPNLEKWHGKALELKQELFGDKEFHGGDSILLYAKFEL
jgi:hypothetical protein